jgi:hypothetical protein
MASLPFCVITSASDHGRKEFSVTRHWNIGRLNLAMQILEYAKELGS